MKYLALAAFAIFAVGCSSNDDTNAATHGNHATNNATTAAVDTYADGLMKMGDAGNFHVMLMSADPAPPDVGENTWMIHVEDMDGNPIDDAVLTVSPYMPAHGHGTNPADYTGMFSEAGNYEVGPFDLFMPGVWETTVKVEGDVDDTVTFTFELEG